MQYITKLNQNKNISCLDQTERTSSLIYLNTSLTHTRINKREVFITLTELFLLDSLAVSSFSPTSKDFQKAAHRDPKMRLRNISLCNYRYMRESLSKLYV